MAGAIKADTISKAITLLSMGETQTDTAKALGISQPTAHVIAKKHQEAINELAVSLITASIKPVLDNHRDILDLSHQLLQIAKGKKASKPTFQLMARIHMLGLEPKDIIALADKKEERFLKMIGIMPAHTQSIVINQLFNSQTNISYSPDAIDMVAGHLDAREIVDVDLGLDNVEDEGSNEGDIEGSIP